MNKIFQLNLFNKLTIVIILLISNSIGRINAQTNVDLALTIDIEYGMSYEIGDIVTFNLVVYNQGESPVHNVQVVDYIPQGLEFISSQNPNWTVNLNQATYTIPDALLPGTTAEIAITLRLRNGAQPSNIWNYAEISNAEDADGNSVANLDVDSVMDSNRDNDNGAEPYSFTDNAINFAMDIDEDDHDVALPIMCVGTTCNGQVNVSLNYSCDVTFQADMMVESPDYPWEAYHLVIKDTLGQIVPNNLINGTHLGQNLEVSVNLPGCEGLGCWGYALIEDKIALELFCGQDTVDCSDTSPEFVGFPLNEILDCDQITDNSYLIAGVNGCSDIILSYEDVREDFNCQTGSPFLYKILRTWTATDGIGNVNTCTSKIYIRKGELSDISSPPDYLNDPINCSDYVALPNGNPTPEYAGYPGGIDCENIIVVYQDTRIDGDCIGRFDVLREWTIVDWCNGTDTVFTQLIKVMDSTAPVCNAPIIINSGTSSSTCGGPVNVPHPNIQDNCSEASYYIQYKPKVIGEDPLDGLSAEGITGNHLVGYQITELPVGEYYMIYFVGDDCGNSTYCISTLIVDDTSVPTTICKTYKHITLNEFGLGYIDAIDLDDGSFDNCTIASYKVARMTTGCAEDSLDFTNRVTLCCKDIEQETMVILRVYDTSGNFNDCMVQVEVVDTQVPVIQCPPDATISCSEYAEDPYLSTLGTATAFDNCNVVVSHFDVHALTNCGVGVVVRTWTAADASGNNTNCKQYIEVVGDYQYDMEDITWPEDIVIDGCPYGFVGTALTGEPLLPLESCSDFDVSYEDEISTGNAACYIIKRIWKVVDQCAINSNTGIFIHDQFIGINDVTAPVITNCQDVVFQAGTDCEEEIYHLIQVVDDCAPSEDIEVRYTIDYFSDGVVDIQNNGSIISGVLPSGLHKVNVYTQDVCENQSSCQFNLQIRDNKAPTPVCLPISVSLGQTGSVEVWASDLNYYSYDNCNPDESLKFSFSEDIYDTNITYNCDSLENGIKKQFTVNLYVWDNDGNYDFCTTWINVTDALDVCPNNATAEGNISGKVMNNANHEDLQEVMVKIRQNGQNLSEQATNELGNYTFGELNLYEEYIISPFKNDDMLNGVSTSDIVKIQKHILQLDIFEDPELFAAADINRSGTITGTDIIMLRKLLLGYYPDDQLPNNTSWRFYPADYSLNDINKFDFPEEVNLAPLEENLDDVMFYGIKVGDVNQTAKSNVVEGDITSRSKAVTLDVQDRKLQKGTVENIIFNVSDPANLVGLQFALGYDETKIDIVALQAPSLVITQEDYHIDNVMIKCSWFNLEGKDIINGDYFLILQVKAREDIFINDIGLQILEERLVSEFIDESDEIRSIDIRIGKNLQNESSNIALNLEQNEPNPFSSETNISFGLSFDGQVILRIFNKFGKTVYEEKKFYQAGHHQKLLREKCFPANGLYYLQVESGNTTKTIKLIKI